MPDASSPLPIPPESAGRTLAAAVRMRVTGASWTEARRLIAERKVRISGSVCLDDARRLRAGETLEILGAPTSPAPEAAVRVLHHDTDLVIIDKPPGILSERRVEERGWPEDRKARQPTLDEVVARLLGDRSSPQARPKSRAARPGHAAPRVRPVHRLDRDTSGLMLYALSPAAEASLTRMFARHEVKRTYHAVVHGRLAAARTIETRVVRDRGDGLRGSIRADAVDAAAKFARTFVEPIEYPNDQLTLVECRLDTGRTHQIRIHLSEIGHPLCGETVYHRKPGETEAGADRSGAPRLALHSAALELRHPVSGRVIGFELPMAADLAAWLDRVRAAARGVH